MLIYFVVLFLSSFIAIGVTLALVSPSLRVILSGLLDPSTTSAYSRLISIGIVVLGLAFGAGFPVKSRSYNGYSSVESWPTPPSEVFEWILLGYRTALSSISGIGAALAVVLFTCLVLHVGLRRAQLSSK